MLFPIMRQRIKRQYATAYGMPLVRQDFSR
jgi:hypothetical protein